MNEILEKFNNDNKLEKYEELILEKDELLATGDSYEIKFQKEFGKEVLELFKEEVECIKLKKIISFIQLKINKGEEIDPEELDSHIFIEMQYYENQINAKLKYLASCEKSKTISTYEVNEIKKIYREVAKLIHPDINNITEENDEINDLWIRIYNCYRKNDLKGIKEAHLLLKKKLDKLGVKNNINIDIKDIDDKIEELQNEILSIQKSVPYIYGEWIYDDEKVQKRHNENKIELEKYKNYEQELKQAIVNLKKGL